MIIKMIATDLDRTLLRTDKTISAYSEAILNRCRNKGIKVLFATARPKRTVKRFINGISVDALILHNGAAIYTAHVLLGNHQIPLEITKKILLSINKDFPEATLSVEIDDVLFANFDVSTIWNETEVEFSDFTDLPNKFADKIIVGLSSPDDINRFAKYIPPDLYIEMNDGKLGLIMNRKATKWEAIKTAAARFNISTDEVAAFGDDYNDISMLQGCGAGIAVANALDEVKAVADFICDSNDNDGVAKWIEENVLFELI